MALNNQGALLTDDNGKPTHVGSYKHITSQTTTVVKASAGFLYKIIFNKPVATATVSVYDDPATSNNAIALITVPASPQPVTLTYDLAFANGCTVITGVADEDITVVYR